MVQTKPDLGIDILFSNSKRASLLRRRTLSLLLSEYGRCIHFSGRFDWMLLKRRGRFRDNLCDRKWSRRNLGSFPCFYAWRLSWSLGSFPHFCVAPDCRLTDSETFATGFKGFLDSFSHFWVCDGLPTVAMLSIPRNSGIFVSAFLIVTRPNMRSIVSVYPTARGLSPSAF